MKTEKSGVKFEKKAIRRHIRRQLSTLSDSSKEAYSQKITKYFLASGLLSTLESLFIYISQPSEVSTEHLIKLALEAGIKVYAPKIINNHMIAQRLLRLDDLILGSWGISEPVETTDSATYADLVVTPGLAFTEKGERLGYGGGFYDKWLSDNFCAGTMALAYDISILENLPVSNHDVQVDGIITETRYINCRKERGDI